MVDLNFCGRRLGTVAIFATLFVAVQVKGENGCVYDVDKENPSRNFDLECNGLRNSWNLELATHSPGKKAFVLEPEEEGCLKTKNPVTLNSTSRIQIKIGRDGTGEEAKFAVKLLPLDGTCSDDECLWIPKDLAESKITDDWLILEHKFPLKANKDCNIQVEVGKRGSRFELSSISVLNPSGTGNCHGDSGKAEVDDHSPHYDRLVETDLRDETTHHAESTTGGGGGSTTPKSAAPLLVEISKNLILSSATVLILNHLIN